MGVYLIFVCNRAAFEAQCGVKVDDFDPEEVKLFVQRSVRVVSYHVENSMLVKIRI